MNICTNLVLAMSATALSSGCWAIRGQTLRTEVKPADSESRFPFLLQPFGAVGEIPYTRVLARLNMLEVLDWYPSEVLPPDNAPAFQVHEMTRVCDAISYIEKAAGLVYLPERRSFYVASATHSVDHPDSFGRPAPGPSLYRASLSARPMVSIGVLFRRVMLNAGYSSEQDAHSIGGGASGTVVWFALPDGVRRAASNQSERSYFETVRDTETGRQLPTTRRTVNGGLVLDALVARLPGGNFRMEGSLEVSSFTGRELDRAVVSVPLEVDAGRSKWHRIYVVRGGDVSAQMAFSRFGFDLLGSGEALEVLVRCE